MKDLEFYVRDKKLKNSYVVLSFLAPENFTDVRPGQFLMVKVPSPDLILRRPISIFNFEDNKFEILFQICGKGTELLSRVKKGDTLKVLGPLGNGFTYENYGTYLIVGGGRGIAPLFFLSKVFLKNGLNFKVLYGGKTSSDLPALEYFDSLDIKPVVTTEDGSAGFKGLVTEALEKILNSEFFSKIYACGPKAMMEKVYSIATNLRIPCQFSLEERMACGFGVCWSCVARIRKGEKEEWVKICKEGPVFNGEDIAW